MNCRELERSLEALLDGVLGADERADCAAHVAACAACRELVAPMGDALDVMAGEPPSSFLPAVLAETTGAACATAHDWLCALVDGEFDATECALAEEHLAGCEDCRSEAIALRGLAAELPRMAEATPDPSFLRDVVFASVPYPPVGPDVVAETWRRWMLRPRFAIEAAYVAVTLSWLIVLTPVSPVSGVLQGASRARAIVSEIRSEAGILLTRATSLMAAAEAKGSAEPVAPSSDPKENP